MAGNFDFDAEGLTQTHAYPQFGSYTAALRVTDDNTPPQTDLTKCRRGREPGQPAAVAEAGGPYWIDVGQDLTLDGRGSSDPNAACGDRIVNYEWDLNSDGTYDYSGATVVVPWAALQSLPQPGAANPIRLRVTDTFGAATANTELKIFVNEPVAAFTAVPNPCGCNQFVSFDASGSTHGRPDRTITRYEWDFDYVAGNFDVDATDRTQRMPTRNSAAYTAALRVTDDNTPPRSDLTEVDVSVSQGNLTPLAEAGGPYWIDVGQELTLDGRGSSDPNAACGDSIVNYEWDLNGDGTYEYLGATTVVPWAALQSLPQPGAAIPVRLRVTDSFGAAGTDDSELKIFINEPAAAFTAVPNPCACNQSVSFDASGSMHGRPDRTITRYEWDFDYVAGSFAVDAEGLTQTHAYPSFGTYTAALRVTDDNTPPRSDLTEVVVSVSLGNLTPLAEAGGPYWIDVGQELTLDGRGSSDPNAACGDSIVKYEWDLNGDGTYEYLGATTVCPGLRCRVCRSRARRSRSGSA